MWFSFNFWLISTRFIFFTQNFGEFQTWSKRGRKSQKVSYIKFHQFSIYSSLLFIQNPFKKLPNPFFIIFSITTSHHPLVSPWKIHHEIAIHSVFRSKSNQNIYKKKVFLSLSLKTLPNNKPKNFIIHPIILFSAQKKSLSILIMLSSFQYEACNCTLE